jgi:hypothetical protein
MHISSEDALLERMRPLVLKEGEGCDGLVNASFALTGMLKKYFKEFGTPKEEEQRLVGHQGLLGELNNSIAHITSNMIKPQLLKEEEDPERARYKAVKGANILCARFWQESQLSKNTDREESVPEAFDRIEDDIGRWLYDHWDSMEKVDREYVADLLETVKTSYAEVKDFIIEAGEFFCERDREGFKDIRVLYTEYQYGFR